MARTGPASQRSPRGWHSRGYLPHFDAGHEYPQSVTFRLGDTLPAAVVRSWQVELAAIPPALQDASFRKRVEAFLETGYGACHLRDLRIGSLVENAILFFDGARYFVHAWVVMPNHVHVLLTPTAGVSLSNILGSWKSYTSKRANKILGRSGQFWHEDYFDRFIRDDAHFADVVAYIEENPVKAGLCLRPEDWLFGSARYRLRISPGPWTSRPHGDSSDPAFGKSR